MNKQKLCEMEYTEKTKWKLLAFGSYKGLDYYVISLGTHPCGYVDCKEHEFNRYDIECNGGITYESDKLGFHYGDLNGHFIGWDYAHCWDYAGYETMFDESLRTGGQKHTTDEIIEECISVIEQILKQESEVKE